MKDLFGQIGKAACFSDNRKHRLWLLRSWDAIKPRLVFIGLNPSTANEHDNDNTITKVMKIAAHNGYGSVYMFNLFTCVTPHPEEIKHNISMDYINIRLIEEYTITNDVVFCWGNFKQAQEISHTIIERIKNPLCIAQNKNGSPKHPLYCKDNSTLIPFTKPNQP